MISTSIGPPLPPDPVLNVVNVSSLRVSWTKPYSLPEYNILSYKVVIYSDGKIFRSADTNGTDSEYIFLAERCMEFTILLSAINSIGESEAATITGGLPIGEDYYYVNFNKFGSDHYIIFYTAVPDQYYMPPINVTIYFQSDETADIEITFPVS